MAEFVKPVIENLLALLETRTPTILDEKGRDQIEHFGKQFTGVVANWPAVFAMPVRTAFNADADVMRYQAHQIQVVIAVTGSTPEAVTDAAMDYMAAIDQAIQEGDPSDWQGVIQGGNILRVFVQGHDYGPLFERGGTSARFPELELVVEASEF
jgi:hypothetical protein